MSDTTPLTDLDTPLTDLEKKASAQSYQVAHHMAAQWLTAKIFLKSELSQADPSMKGQLPDDFVEAWQKFGVALLQGRAKQFQLFIDSLNTLPSQMVVPLIKVSAELGLIPKRFETELMTKLSLRKNTLPIGGLHG